MMSYNGYLRLHLTSDPTHLVDFNAFPLVHIIASSILHLHYSYPGHEYLSGEVIDVKLHEVRVYRFFILLNRFYILSEFLFH